MADIVIIRKRGKFNIIMKITKLTLLIIIFGCTCCRPVKKLPSVFESYEVHIIYNNYNGENYINDLPYQTLSFVFYPTNNNIDTTEWANAQIFLLSDTSSARPDTISVFTTMNAQKNIVYATIDNRCFDSTLYNYYKNSPCLFSHWIIKVGDSFHKLKATDKQKIRYFLNNREVNLEIDSALIDSAIYFDKSISSKFIEHILE